MTSNTMVIHSFNSDMIKVEIFVAQNVSLQEAGSNRWQLCKANG